MKQFNEQLVLAVKGLKVIQLERTNGQYRKDKQVDMANTGKLKQI